MPVWCLHGAKDGIVPVEQSRRLIAGLERLKFRHRYDELADWGHQVWDWLYTPQREEDSLADWFLQYRRATPAPPRRQADREGTWLDIFGERLIISYPAQTPIPKESELLRAEAERLAAFHFGEDLFMRSGRLLVKADTELTKDDLRSAGHLMLGRSDNHVHLRAAERRLLARHVKGQLRVGGETYLGKSLLAATLQPSPWNRNRLLAILTYQQYRQMRGFGEKLVTATVPPLRVNLYDTQQRRFLRREA